LLGVLRFGGEDQRRLPSTKSRTPDYAAALDDAVWVAGSRQTLSRKHANAASLGTLPECGCVAETSRSSFAISGALE